MICSSLNRPFFIASFSFSSSSATLENLKYEWWSFSRAGHKDDLRYVFEKAFHGLVIDRMDGNDEIFGKLIADGKFRKLAVEHLLHKIYGALKKTEK